ncbi:trichoplein keratin filament-binding protein [Eucyclogobius newberryi]|uniref:trichoplein keratin filament-binding protein n=1 Tax=Eucyclogobius newberryi TaxID=166745 RepID=UPI003B5BC8B1
MLVMALPTLCDYDSKRPRTWAGQMALQRERQTLRREQCELHAQYFKEQSVRCKKQAAWSSRQSYQQSMSAYHKQKLEEEKRISLEKRRARLSAMLQEEQNCLEAELRKVVPDNSTLTSQLAQKTAELRTAREETRRQVADVLLKEHWKKNNPDLRELESTLHKDHVIKQWKEQIIDKREQKVAEQEEKRRFENEYESARREALERIRQEEERKKAEDLKRAEELRKQMEELKLREEEATHLKKEQEALLAQQWELEKIEEERRRAEEWKKKSETRHFLIRQYRTQLKRRAQQVQEELEADRRILANLVKGEEKDKRHETERRERAIADAAWMKQVIEEQLQLERAREAEMDYLHRGEAQHVWEKREAQWEKERRARERLMKEVLAGRQQQLKLKMCQNREAQEESLKRREELIQELEMEKELQQQEKELEEGRRRARKKEMDTQVEQNRQEQWEEQMWMEQLEEEEQKTQRRQEEQLRLEVQRMAQKGYEDRIRSRPRSAWT